MKILYIACIFLFTLSFALADDDDQPSNNKNAETHANGSVFLSEAAQSISGIQTLTLAPAEHRAEYITYGKALNIQALLELRHQYLIAASERGGAMARYLQSEQNIKRQQDLFQAGATSERNLQAQQAQWKSDKAQTDAIKAQNQAIRDQARLTWGETLTDWALTPVPDKLNPFLSGQKTLLLISLPAGKSLSANIRTIHVETSGNRTIASQAELISPAPQTETIAQGENYFFQAEDKRIKPGSRIAAWVPEQTETHSGVIVPKSALIWHLNQAFVYIKTDAEHFNRRAVEQYTETAGGYFIEDNIEAGEQAVITGGQMLLSEEFKGQIPDEDD